MQRLLGLGDLVVSTAGGGSQAHGRPGGSQTPWHSGVLHAVDNAEEIRDLIQERLRRLKSSGTGDSDDREPTAPIAIKPTAPFPPQLPSETTLVAKELLAEVRALRTALRVKS